MSVTVTPWEWSRCRSKRRAPTRRHWWATTSRWTLLPFCYPAAPPNKTPGSEKHDSQYSMHSQQMHHRRISMYTNLMKFLLSRRLRGKVNWRATKNPNRLLTRSDGQSAKYEQQVTGDSCMSMGYGFSKQGYPGDSRSITTRSFCSSTTIA